jgi:hypothetical protein
VVTRVPQRVTPTHMTQQQPMVVRRHLPRRHHPVAAQGLVGPTLQQQQQQQQQQGWRVGPRPCKVPGQCGRWRLLLVSLGGRGWPLVGDLPIIAPVTAGAMQTIPASTPPNTPTRSSNSSSRSSSSSSHTTSRTPVRHPLHTPVPPARPKGAVPLLGGTKWRHC